MIRPVRSPGHGGEAVERVGTSGQIGHLVPRFPPRPQRRNDPVPRQQISITDQDTQRHESLWPSYDGVGRVVSLESTLDQISSRFKKGRSEQLVFQDSIVARQVEERGPYHIIVLRNADLDHLFRGNKRSQSPAVHALDHESGETRQDKGSEGGNHGLSRGGGGGDSPEMVSQNFSG